MSNNLTIWGRVTSSNVQVVMWTIAELGLDHQRIDAGGSFGGTATPEYRAMNPNGLVPVMRDDDLVMFESNAITRYLAARYGNGKLLSNDPQTRARQDMWMEWAKTTLYPRVIGGIFWTLVRTPKADRDAKALANHVAAAAAAMGIVEAELAKHDWLSGDDFSLADIGLGSLLYRYFTLEFDRPELPHLQAYYDRLCQREAFRTHAMVSYEDLRVA
jgi:glutathione S-transferase